MLNWKSDESGLEWLEPDWSVPVRVRAISTTRKGGVSLVPFDSLNLGLHVGDDNRTVEENRRRLVNACGLPGEPVWLNQVHGCGVVARPVGRPVDADAAWTDRSGDVCVVMTADCLPLLLCNSVGTEVAAVHAGWRGLCGGVVEAAITEFTTAASDLLAWLGPAIGPTAFEVGPEVRDAFMAADGEAGRAFQSGQNSNRWMADLYELARMRLRRAGVTQISGGGLCTYSDRQHFYSYRRDGLTGRMATMIWIDPEDD